MTTKNAVATIIVRANVAPSPALALTPQVIEIGTVREITTATVAEIVTMTGTETTGATVTTETATKDVATERLSLAVGRTGTIATVIALAIKTTVAGVATSSSPQSLPSTLVAPHSGLISCSSLLVAAVRSSRRRRMVNSETPVFARSLTFQLKGQRKMSKKKRHF